MQSGISVSKELRAAFEDLTSSGTNFAIVARIHDEQIVPSETLPARSQAFLDNVEQLEVALEADEGAYIVLRRYNDAPDAFIAVTFVPDSANVRQKMLFASTRLTLVRELGAERFRETLFATTKQELTAEGWRKHDQHGALKAPLTEEELTLQDVREAEAEASRGTSARSSHVSSGLSFPVSAEALQALRQLPDMIDTHRESVELASVTTAESEEIATRISDSEPRFTFYHYKVRGGNEQPSVVFIYTCPAASIKERMVYASSRAGIINRVSEEVGLEIAKKLEASLPSEITASTLDEEFQPKVATRSGFARPKRPGRSTATDQ